jgi:16S rRNA (guanine966-N2)-methyltransferase
MCIMKITAGKYKSKQIKTVDTLEVRPTSSKVRESIFNILQNKVSEAIMLDLFAGSGIMGLEALSRGASKVVFVEKNLKIFKLLKENLCNFDVQYDVLLKDAITALNKLKGSKFDIIFADPPYKLDIIPDVLRMVKENSLLAKDGVIIIEHSSKYKFEANGFEVIKTKEYGDTMISFFKVSLL